MEDFAGAGASGPRVCQCLNAVYLHMLQAMPMARGTWNAMCMPSIVKGTSTMSEQGHGPRAHMLRWSTQKWTYGMSVVVWGAMESEPRACQKWTYGMSSTRPRRRRRRRSKEHGYPLVGGPRICPWLRGIHGKVVVCGSQGEMDLGMAGMRSCKDFQRCQWRGKHGGRICQSTPWGDRRYRSKGRSHFPCPQHGFTFPLPLASSIACANAQC